ncbi:MAG: SDR family oxidoreductase [Mycobacterium sp.]|nr:SDR family oxidoreductase [Mycobacterium sp.]
MCPDYSSTLGWAQRATGAAVTEQLLLEGRAAVVVGGSRGIGRAVSELLAACGADVVVNGRDPTAAADAASDITGHGGRAIAHAGSPVDEAAADRLIDSCVREFGRIDILVNCAGIPEPRGSSILNITTAEFAGLLEAHLWTVFQTCRAAAPRMAEQRSGAIINTSSIAFRGDYGGTGYPAGKGAVNGFTMALAADLKVHGVRANVVCPGAKTRLSSGPDYEAQIADLHRRGLLDDATMQLSLDAPPPEHAAPIYAYLASDMATVSGEIFVAAGGFVGRFDRTGPTMLGYRDHNVNQPWSITELQMITQERSQ